MTTIDALWAVDADGRQVPFSLSGEGTDIVMTVLHHERRFAYPIVVDPSIRTDCGIITCSVYLSRSITSALQTRPPARYSYPYAPRLAPALRFADFS